MSHVRQNDNEKIQRERRLITGQGPDTAWETSGGQFDGSSYRTEVIRSGSDVDYDDMAGSERSEAACNCGLILWDFIVLFFTDLLLEYAALRVN